MNRSRDLLYMLIAVLFAACMPTAETAIVPTLVQFPTSTDTPTNTVTPVPPSATAIPPTPTNTVTPTPSATAIPPTASVQIILTIPPALPTATATLLPAQFSFGRSVEGADLLAWRIGSGSRLIVLVGGIHTGFEANTVELVSELRDYFLSNPDRIQPDVALLLIPLLNPDGMQYGRTLRGRFNANGVDLNRNWACGWSAQAVFRDEPVNAGSAAFSEPETTALGSLIQRIQPAAVLIYHGAANGVFGGQCEGEDAGSSQLGAVYGQASGYPSGESFDGYEVTGSAPAWLASMGIPALDVELATSTGSEFERNLRAVMAVQEWLQKRPQEP